MKLAVAAGLTLLAGLSFLWSMTSATPVYRTAPSLVQEAAARTASEEAFLANCLTNGAGTQFCGCMADGLQARLTTAQLAALNSSNATTREQPQVVSAVSQVTEGCTIPLQLSQVN